MSGERVVHCKRSPYDIYIGRPSRWGNPFPLTNEEDRARCVQRYEDWIRTQPNLMAALPELKGKVLGCWCYPRLCHGNVLIKLLDELSQNEEAAQGNNP